MYPKLFADKYGEELNSGSLSKEAVEAAYEVLKSYETDIWSNAKYNLIKIYTGLLRYIYIPKHQTWFNSIVTIDGYDTYMRCIVDPILDEKLTIPQHIQEYCYNIARENISLEDRVDISIFPENIPDEFKFDNGTEFNKMINYLLDKYKVEGRNDI